MSSCTILAHVKRPDGTIVESNLFKDLLKYTSSRSEAKQNYAAATNPEFLKMAGSRAKFDENGEITFKSYKEIAELPDDPKLVEKLKSDLGTGSYSYGEAVNRIQNFNLNNPYNNKYFATLVPDGKNFKVDIVKNKQSNRDNLEKIVKNQTLKDRMIFQLSKLGVAVDFLQNPGFEGGRYSTVNAEQAADGMYHLIQIAHGEKVTYALAEEAGHFAVGALGDSDLVKRLETLLTTDVQKQILGSEYEDKALGINPQREVAGVLVGRALADKVDDKMMWQKLAHRIATAAKKIFYTLKGDDVKLARLFAEETARKIANNFMSSKFNGNLENALKTQETLYDAKPPYNVKVYNQITQNFKITVDRLKAIANDQFAKDVEAMNASIAAGKGAILSGDSTLSQTFALDGIAEAMSLLLDYIGADKPINNLLDEIDFKNAGNFMSTITENGTKLRQVETFCKNATVILSIVNDAINKTPGKETLTGDAKVYYEGRQIALIESARLLQEQINNLTSNLETKQRQYFTRFCELIYGENYITRSTKVVFKKEGGKLIRKPILVEGTTKDIHDFIEQTLTHLDGDISLFERYLASMSNNPDVIGQIIDKAVKNTNKLADDQTNLAFDYLRTLRKRFLDLEYVDENGNRKKCKDTSFLFEKYDDGSLTGNIISEYHWGNWEKARKEFFEKAKEEFNDTYKDTLSLLGESEKTLLWQNFFHAKYKDWNEKNSIYDDEAERWMPNEMYRNPEFNRLLPEGSELRQWYNDFMIFKRSLDDRLPEGSTISVRMPQFKGTFMNKVQNRHLFESGLKSMTHTLRSSLLDKFCEDSTDQEYGSDQTYNSEEEQMFYSELADAKEKINRLPLFGINKLKDMSKLSTDLFHSTLAYASMANSYMTTEMIVHAVEVGKSVLQRRKVGTVDREKDKDGDKSRVYNRYLKYVEKQVYGVSMKKHTYQVWNIKNDKGEREPIVIVSEKISNILNRLSAYMFLGGNVLGGIVNTGTGFIEIFKEAATGEYYNLDDWRKALKQYFSYGLVGHFGVVSSIVDFGSNEPHSKMNLMIRHFNMLGENRVQYREFETRHSWLRNAIGNSIFFPYKSGDHFMQSMSYLALGNHIKVYDENGKESSLMDAYEVVDNTDDNDKNKAGKTIHLKTTYFKEKDGKQKFDFIQDIIDKINNDDLSMTQAEQDFLDSKKISLSNKGNALRLLSEAQDELTWNQLDESNFMNKAREINNRLHGIYNNIDKVAFSQNLYGNMFLCMKGWALGMAERRFGANHYSVVLGQDVEGSITTLLKVWSRCGSREDFWNCMRATFLPFSNKSAQKFQNLGFSANQWRNMKRNYFDMMAIALLWLIRGLTALSGDDDKDDEYYKRLYGKNWRKVKKQKEAEGNIAVGLIHYFANRLYREQSALNNPTGLYFESTTLLDLMPSGVTACLEIYKFTKMLSGSFFADKENSEYFYQTEVEGKYDKYDPKWLTKLISFIPYWKSVYNIQHPYQATKSYEYGRNVKNR